MTAPQQRELFEEVANVLKPKQVKAVKKKRYLDSINVMNLLACTGFLLELFGRDLLKVELNYYEQEGWIDGETKESILAAEKILISADNSGEYSKHLDQTKKLSVEDHITALYLINKLTRDDPIALLTFFFVLKKAVSNIE